MKMKDMPSSERPREKLLEKGPQSLSDGELISVLLRNGAGARSALDLSVELLSSAGGSLVELFSRSRRRLCSIGGIGPCKAASVMAAFELGRRFLLESSLDSRTPVVTSRMVYDIMIPQMKGLTHEECWVLFLNDANYLIDRVRLTSGGGNSTVIDKKMIVRDAIERNATGVILVHNHPSHNPHPSAADVSMTDALRKALSPFDIALIDHVIVCDSRFFSFSEDRAFSAVCN